MSTQIRPLRSFCWRLKQVAGSDQDSGRLIREEHNANSTAMFLIASSGRCGTAAICTGLDVFSDHDVRHEPEPLLLHEAWLKHCGQPYRTPQFEARLNGLRQLAGTNYGESWRAPNLLPDIADAVPGMRFLVAIRDPHEYLRSAHFMKVLRKGGRWDKKRLLPDGVQEKALAERIAWHWVTVNTYLLDFAQVYDAPVFRLGDWADQLEKLPNWLGITLHDPAGLRQSLSARANASTTHEFPDDYIPSVIQSICESTWERAAKIAS